MPIPNRLLFVLADGAHARFVQRNRETGAFVTVRELDGSHRLKNLRRELRGGPPPGRSHESASTARHGVGREDYERQAKEAFVTQVAQEACEFATPNDALVVVAPSRLVSAFRERLGERAAAVVAKDLIKTPDAELARWLEPLTLQVRAPIS
ncbi:MAG: host attachment protein [Ignavibacteriales bacterium]